jgi:LacI family transcriptional regulator
MAVTLSDVADRAGVSPATVSRVLNGNYPVAAKTRQRVEKAIRDLDYVVNAHARALLHATSGMIGVVLNDLADPFFATVASGIQSAALPMQRLVIVCSSGGDQETEFAYIEMLRRHRAEVVILVGSSPEDAAYKRALAGQAKGLHAQGSRLVLCGRPAPSRHTPAAVVSVDESRSLRELAEYLSQQGHRRIGYLAGPPNQSTSTARRSSLTNALQRVGIRLPDGFVAQGEFTRESGYEATCRLISGGVKFTALCAANDLMAAGAMRALDESGVDVPGDVSVIGFDDLPVATDITPKLTTIRVPLVEVGQHAVAMAFAPESANRRRLLPTRLIVRGSSGRAVGTREARRTA